MLGRVTMHMGTVAVGNDQSCLWRKQLARQFTWKCKEQSITVSAIAFPFLVGPQILTRGFDFDDPQLAPFVHCHQIGPATGRQWQFPNARKTQRGEETRRAPRYQACGFGLAAIDGSGHDIERRLEHSAIINAVIAVTRGNAGVIRTTLVLSTAMHLQAQVRARSTIRARERLTALLLLCEFLGALS